MSTSSRISIALAVYNGDRYLHQQLEALARQSRLPDELIIGDNASTDHTIEMVLEFAKTAPFEVRLITNDRNLGVTQNFERAIRGCSGDLIFLSDCDDVWYPDKLAVMEDAFARWPGAGVVVCDADLVDENLNSLGRSLWQAFGFTLDDESEARMARGEVFRPGFPAIGNCMAFRAAFKELILPLPVGEVFERGGHDYFIAWTIVGSGAGGLVPVPQRLIAYRQHSRSMSGYTKGTLTERVRQRWSGKRKRSSIVLAPVAERIEQIALTRRANAELRNALLAHWKARLGMPKGRMARLPVVCMELSSGRYHRFSSGLMTAVKDLAFAE